MIFGGAESELLQLNENTLYSGEPSVIFDDIRVTPEAFEQVVSLLRASLILAMQLQQPHLLTMAPL